MKTTNEIPELMKECSFRGPAQRGAFKAGAVARLKGSPMASPYADCRGGRHNQIITWSRSFDAAWKQGWRAADRLDNGEALPPPPGEK